MHYQGALNIAIVHDELTRRGGAEVVLEKLIELFPQAHIYTLYAGKPKIKINNKTINVKTSFLQKAPLWFKKHPSRLLLALPHAAEQFDLSSYDLVISSSSGFSKAIITRVNVTHICYCHTPTRYLWDAAHEVLNRHKLLPKLPARLIFHYLRIADYAAAQRVDRFIANSRYTQKRIKSYYNRQSEVIYPPIDTSFFTPSYQENKQPYFLCVGRLRPSKHFDRVARVTGKLNLPLVIIGQGEEKQKIIKHSNGKVRIINHAGREELRQYYRQARALIQTATEDFGMACAESIACGTPVIACANGGAKEIISDQETGILYQDDSDEALADAIRRFIRKEKDFNRETLQHTALKFADTNWQKNILETVKEYETNDKNGFG